MYLVHRPFLVHQTFLCKIGTSTDFSIGRKQGFSTGTSFKKKFCETSFFSRVLMGLGIICEKRKFRFSTINLS
jgi:hypothetical protein